MNGEWTSVKDRLPEDDVAVLIFIAGRMKEQDVAKHRHGDWYDTGMGEEYINSDFVTHWMPLPLEPKP